MHDTVKTDPYAISFTSILDLTPKEKEHMQKYTDGLYAKFLQEVAIGRKMKVEDVDKIAQGRVWTGTKAKELGLIDEIGDLEYSINLAAEKANLKEYSTVYFPEIKVSPFKKIMESILPEENPVSVKSSSLSIEIQNVLDKIKHITSQKSPQAHLPFQFYWD
jgi:protease-4